MSLLSDLPLPPKWVTSFMDGPKPSHTYICRATTKNSKYGPASKSFKPNNYMLQHSWTNLSKYLEETSKCKVIM